MRDVDQRDDGGNLVAAAVAIIEKKNQTRNDSNGINAIDLYGSIRRKAKGKSVDYGKISTEGVDSVDSGKSAFTNLGFFSKNNHRAGSGELRPPDTNGKQSPAINSQTRTEEREEGEESAKKVAATTTDDIFELAIHDFDLTAEEVQKIVLESGNKKVEFS